MPDTEKRLKPWQKFQIESDVAINLRTMLGLGDFDELPEALWIIMGIHRAMERQFPCPSLSFRDLATMIVEAQAIQPRLMIQKRRFMVPGTLVKVKLAQKMGHYWHPGPLGLHLINCYGDLFLVPADGFDPTEPPKEEESAEGSRSDLEPAESEALASASA